MTAVAQRWWGWDPLRGPGACNGSYGVMMQSMLSLSGAFGNRYLVVSICAVVVLVVVAVVISVRNARARRLDTVTPKLPTRQYLTGEEVFAVLCEWAEIKARVDGLPRPSPRPVGVGPISPLASPPPPRLVKDFAGAPPVTSASETLEDEQRERLWNELVRSALRARTPDTWSREQPTLTSPPHVTALESRRLTERVHHGRRNIAGPSG